MRKTISGGITAFLFLMILLSVSVYGYQNSYTWNHYQGVNAGGVFGMATGLSYGSDNWDEATDYDLYTIPGVNYNPDGNLIVDTDNITYLIRHSSTIIYQYMYNISESAFQLQDTFAPVIANFARRPSSLRVGSTTYVVFGNNDNDSYHMILVNQSGLFPVINHSYYTYSATYGADLGVTCSNEAGFCVGIEQTNGNLFGGSVFNTTFINYTSSSPYGIHANNGIYARTSYSGMGQPIIYDLDSDGIYEVFFLSTIVGADTAINHFEINPITWAYELNSEFNGGNRLQISDGDDIFTNLIVDDQTTYGKYIAFFGVDNNIIADDYGYVLRVYDAFGTERYDALGVDNPRIEACDVSTYNHQLTYYQPALQFGLFICGACMNHDVSHTNIYLECFDIYDGESLYSATLQRNYTTSEGAFVGSTTGHDENIITGNFKDSGQLFIENYLIDDTLTLIQEIDIPTSNSVSVIAGDLMNIDGANEFDFVLTSETTTNIIYRSKTNSAPYQTSEEICPANPVCLDVPARITYHFDDDDSDILNYSYSCEYTPGMNESSFDAQNVTYSYADGFQQYCTYTTAGVHTFFIRINDAYNHSINDTYSVVVINSTYPTCYSDYSTCTSYTPTTTTTTTETAAVTGIGETFTSGMDRYFGSDTDSRAIVAFFILIFGVIICGGLAYTASKSGLVAGIVTAISAIFGVIILVGMGMLSFLYLLMLGLGMILLIGAMVLWYIGGR